MKFSVAHVVSAVMGERAFDCTEHGRTYTRDEVRELLCRLLVTHPDPLPQARFRTQRDMAAAAGVTQGVVGWVLRGSMTPGVKLPALLGLVRSDDNRRCKTYVKKLEVQP